MWLQMNGNTVEYANKQLIVSLLNFLRWLFYISNDNLRLRPILKASTICFFKDVVEIMILYNHSDQNNRATLTYQWSDVEN